MAHLQLPKIVALLFIILFLVKKDTAAASLKKLVAHRGDLARTCTKVNGLDNCEVVKTRISQENSAATSAFTPEAEKDRVEKLPGQPDVPFSQYAGYVTVDKGKGKAFFYWLTEAEEGAQSKPLLLWLNGGPGCSSIAYGASEEIGPFRIRKTGDSLRRNHNSWNKRANLLFVESPAGVGFSYSNSSSDYETGDSQTAADNLQFLLNWFERFPQYKYRQFYLSGESYAGHYVPQLAKALHEYNQNLSQPWINLIGFLVGNAVTDNEQDNNGIVDFWWSHAIISDETYHEIKANCNFSSSTVQYSCNNIINYAFQHEFGSIDPYSIYAPVCRQTSNSSSGIHSKSRREISGATDLKHPNSLPRLLTLLRNRLAGFDPCSQSYSELYYNRPDVQLSFHANTTSIPYKWTACSSIINENWQDQAESILPIYRELIAAGLRIWVFSGDTDSVIPVTASRYSLNKLNLRVKTAWYPWYHNNEVGGWTLEYEGLTFATVRGAGHEVPDVQPSRAFVLASSFLAGTPLPS